MYINVLKEQCFASPARCKLHFMATPNVFQTGSAVAKIAAPTLLGHSVET